MRPIGPIDKAEDAHRFGDYLIASGVGCEVSRESDGWCVWVWKDDDYAGALKEFEDFRLEPEHERYARAASAAERAAAEAHADDERRRKHIITMREGWSRQISGMGGLMQKARGTRGLTLALIIACIVVALITQLGNNLETVGYFTIASMRIEDRQLAWDGLDDIANGQVWRIITPIFLHFGLLHILFNMWWLRDLGTMIEQRKGHLALALIVLVSGVIGNLAQYVASGPLFGGMSGVVYALFGYIWIKGVLQPQEGMHVTKNTVVWMLGWLVLCMTGMMGNIGNAAHVVGLVTGMGMAGAAYLLARVRRGA